MGAVELTLLKGQFHEVSSSKLPRSTVGFGYIMTRLNSDDRVDIMVHGYRWNPTKANDDNPHKYQWPFWSFVSDPSIGLGWHSSPTFFDSWKSGHAHPYHCAWARAEETSISLSELIEAIPQPINLIGHSLGTRVVLQSLLKARNPNVHRVLLLNGAEASKNAEKVAEENPDIEFYNIMARSDRILRYLGGLFTPGVLYEPVIGLHGLKDPPENWHQIMLGNKKVVAWAEALGWELKAHGHLGLSGHFTSFRHKGNHGLFRAILDGEKLKLPGTLIAG